MAADYISVNRAKQLGNNLVRAADLLTEVRGLINELVAHGSHMNDGVSYAVMEANFGLATGAGANALTLLNIMNDNLNTATEQTGANRLAQFDEFCARVAGQ